MVPLECVVMTSRLLMFRLSLPRPSAFGLLLAGLLLALPLHAATPPRPRPSLSPADVVRIQLSALQHNDDPRPDAGVATVYAFASPGNHKLTGSLSHFTQMLHAGYAPMFDSRRIILGKTQVKGREAAQPVDLVAADGRIFAYVFLLTRQRHAPFENCWMTDSVVPHDTGRGAGQSI